MDPYKCTRQGSYKNDIRLSLVALCEKIEPYKEKNTNSRQSGMGITQYIYQNLAKYIFGQGSSFSKTKHNNIQHSYLKYQRIPWDNTKLIPL